MVFVNSPWDNCNLRWIVHSGLPVTIYWVWGVCYSGTRVQKCRVRAPRLSSDLQYIPVCLCSPITHSKAVICTDLKGRRRASEWAERWREQNYRMHRTVSNISEPEPPCVTFMPSIHGVQLHNDSSDTHDYFNFCF